MLNSITPATAKFIRLGLLYLGYLCLVAGIIVLLIACFGNFGQGSEGMRPVYFAGCIAALANGLFLLLGSMAAEYLIQKLDLSEQEDPEPYE